MSPTADYDVAPASTGISPSCPPPSCRDNPQSPATGQMPRQNAASFSLICLFQILTACCIFFAVLKVSAVLAIVGTVVATPAIIRTSLVADHYRQLRKPYRWSQRLWTFLESLGLTVCTMALALTVFAVVSLSFGLFCLGAAQVMGTENLSSDIAVVGTAGGMVWGAAAGILAFGLCVRKWHIIISASPKKGRSDLS